MKVKELIEPLEPRIDIPPGTLISALKQAGLKKEK